MKNNKNIMYAVVLRYYNAVTKEQVNTIEKISDDMVSLVLEYSNKNLPRLCHTTHENPSYVLWRITDEDLIK